MKSTKHRMPNLIGGNIFTRPSTKQRLCGGRLRQECRGIATVCGVTQPIVVRNPLLPDPIVDGWQKTMKPESSTPQDLTPQICIPAFRVTTVAWLTITKGLSYYLEAIAQVTVRYPASNFCLLRQWRPTPGAIGESDSTWLGWATDLCRCVHHAGRVVADHGQTHHLYSPRSSKGSLWHSSKRCPTAAPLSRPRWWYSHSDHRRCQWPVMRTQRPPTALANAICRLFAAGVAAADGASGSGHL